MIDLDTRTAILRLRDEHHGTRAIARVLGISRGAVKKVIRVGVPDVPPMARTSEAEEHAEQVRELYLRCEGNLVRVHEELGTAGVQLGYSTLTALCRKHEIGVEPKRAAGQYHFSPGQESQHDTSPHDIMVGGRRRRYQCASLVLCFCHAIFAQVYSTFTRFHAKVFLTEALRYFLGAAGRTVVDNTHVIVAYGTGADAIMAPEMVAFAERFGFRFMAHEKGDANRSALVERPFSYIEGNFYPGRTFQDLHDLNRQLVAWCDKVNASYRPKLRIIPNELLAIERPHLRPLPIHIPDVYQLHERLIDNEGYVAVHSNRYSAPEQLIHRDVQVHEAKDRIRVFYGHQLIADHAAEDPGLGKKVTLAQHRSPRHGKGPPPPSPEETALRRADSVLDQMVDQLRRNHRGPKGWAIRRLYALWRDYPSAPVLDAVRDALRYEMFDMERLETMILTRVRGDFFRMNEDPPDE